MELHIDRTLPISLPEQIKRQIVYAITCSRLGPGQALPSVRQHDQQLGVSSVTVYQVYRQLTNEKLIASEPPSAAPHSQLWPT